MAQRSAHLSRLKQFERGTETLLARIDDLSRAEKCGLLDAAFQHWSQACLEKWNIDLLQVVQLWSNSNKNASEVPDVEQADLSLLSGAQPSARTLRASRRRRGPGLSRLSVELRREDEGTAENEELSSTSPPCDPPRRLELRVNKHTLSPTLPVLPALTAPMAPMTSPNAFPIALSIAPSTALPQLYQQLYQQLFRQILCQVFHQQLRA